MNYANQYKLICNIFMSSNNYLYVFKYIKMSKDWSAKFYQKNKGRLQKKKNCERCQSLCKEEKEKKQQYSHKRNKNLQEDEKQNLVEYRKKY